MGRLIDALSLKEYLRNKEDDVVKILEHIGIETETIKYHSSQNYLSMCRKGGDNKNGDVPPALSAMLRERTEL